MKMVALGMLVALTVAANAFAHHSPIVFDRSREVRIEGVVKEFKWSMPHSWIQVDVKDENGEVATWGVEMNPASSLARSQRMSPYAAAAGTRKNQKTQNR